MSVIDDALTAILQGSNPKASPEEIQAQVAQLKHSGGEAVDQALSFIPGLKDMKDVAVNTPALISSAAKTPMGASIASTLTGGPAANGVPNPGNPVSDVTNGALASLATPPASTPPSSPALPPTPSAAPAPVTPLPADTTSDDTDDSDSTAPATPPAPPSPLIPSGNDQAARAVGLAAAAKQRQMQIIPGLVAGAGDTIGKGLAAFGVKTPTDQQAQLMDKAQQNFQESQGLLDQKIKNDPNSDVSKAYRQMVLQIAPDMAKNQNFINMSASDIGDKLPLIDTMVKAQASKDAKELGLQQAQSNKDLSLSLRNDQQQDKLEQNAKQMVSNLRGDKSLARTEEQRDAAAVAYNRLNEIQASGKQPNPVDYADILGQIYKARTGTAPGEQIMNQINQATAKGSLDKAYTFITGNQAPATTQDITNSLKNMAQSMGKQADIFHDGYMKAHLIKPAGLDDSRWQPILQTGRGISFADATKQNQAAPSSANPSSNDPLGIR